MAGQVRAAPADLTLEEALEREPERFDFFQALRRLECAHADKPRLGEALRSNDDPVRLGEEPSLAFAPRTVASFRRPRADRPPRLSVFSFGLFGPNSPLPLHLTEYARDRLRNFNDPTFARFADLFHHRLLCLFYRAWANARPTVHYDRPESDRFAFYVGSLCGLGMPSLRNRDDLPDLTKLHYAGRLAGPARGAEGLRDLLAAFFQVPLEIEQFVGHWLELPEQSRCRLGESATTGALGETAILGGRVWTCQQKFRVVMGPLTLRDYRRLLPGGESQKRLVSLVRTYLGDELTWDVNLILRRDEVPPLGLDGTAQLGLTTWCASRPPETDPKELTLKPRA